MQPNRDPCVPRFLDFEFFPETKPFWYAQCYSMNDLFSRKCSFNISYLWLNICTRVDCSRTMTPTFTDWEPTTSSCQWTALIKPECAITRGMGHRHLTIKVSPLSVVSGCNLRIVPWWPDSSLTWLVSSPLLNSMRHAGDGTRDVWPKGMNAKGPRINIRLRGDWGWFSVSTTCSLPCSHGFLWGRRTWQSPKNLCVRARQLIMLRAGQIKYLHWRSS